MLQRETASPAFLMLVLTGPAGLPAALAELIVRPLAHARRQMRLNIKRVARLLNTHPCFQNFEENLMSFRVMTSTMKPEVRAFYGGFVWGDRVRVVSLDPAMIGAYPLRRASGDRAHRRASDHVPVDPSFLNSIYEICNVHKAGRCGFLNRKGWGYMLCDISTGSSVFGNQKIVVHRADCLQMILATD